MKDSNVRLEAIQLVKESIGNKLFDNGLSDIFPDLSPQARETKAKLNRWYYQTKDLLYSEGHY